MLDNDDIVKLSEVFATKEDIKNFATKDDVLEFKSEILKGQDEILEKLTALSQEKTFEDEQNKRQKEVLKIHNEALKRSKILTEEEGLKISQSGVF
jgi:hypothetical protein